MRRLLAILLPGLLLLTACGGTPPAPEPTSQSAGETAKLDSVKLTDNGDKKAPGVEFAKPLEVKENTIKVITEGDGDRASANQWVGISYVLVNGADGAVVEDGFQKPLMPLHLNDKTKNSDPLLYNALVGAKVGSQLGLALPGQAAAEGAEAVPSQLVVLKLLAAKDVPAGPEGDAVTPPAGLPTVKDKDQGIPEISVEGAAAPAALISQDLIKGKGPEVKATDVLVVNYVGVTHSDGKKFDSSYDKGEQAGFALEGLYEGWKQGLPGKTVGSRVLLVIPAAMGNPSPGRGPEGDLVFVVDILAVL